MLGKLIKHEWKSIGKTILLINLFLIILTVLGMISFASQLWSIDSVIIEVSAVASLLLYYFSIFGIMIAVTIYLYVRFYKNLYTSEGYLMHTLPVTARSLILSKVITGTLSMLITFFNIFICLAALFVSLLLTEEHDFAASFTLFRTEVIPVFHEAFGIDFGVFILLLLVSFVIAYLNATLLGYASISLGQLYSKHKVLGCFISFFGLQMIMQFIGIFITMPTIFRYMSFAMDASENLAPLYKNIMFSSIGFSFVLCIIYYAITEIIMSRKLNLD